MHIQHDETSETSQLTDVKPDANTCTGSAYCTQNSKHLATVLSPVMT